MIVIFNGLVSFAVSRLPVGVCVSTRLDGRLSRGMGGMLRL